MRDTGRTIQRTEPSAGVLRRKTGQKTGTAMKWAGTSTGTAGVSKAAGTSVKGTAAAAKGTAAIASGAVTAGTSTAVSAVTIAAKVAKRAAERVQEALEASLAKSHASGTALTGQNQDGPLGYGKNGTQKGSGLAVLGIFSGILMLVLCTMLSVLLLLPLAMHQELEGQAGAEKGKQIVAVARQEAADAEKNIGGSKYKTWYGMDDNWCAIFVSWCASQCGYIEGGIIPKTASVANMKSWYQQRGLYFAKESGYEPKAGDVILFGNGEVPYGAGRGL